MATTRRGCSKDCAVPGGPQLGGRAVQCKRNACAARCVRECACKPSRNPRCSSGTPPRAQREVRAPGRAGWPAEARRGGGTWRRQPPSRRWIACDACEKWRRVPAALAREIGEDQKWTCAQNPRSAGASCDAPKSGCAKTKRGTRRREGFQKAFATSAYCTNARTLSPRVWCLNPPTTTSTVRSPSVVALTCLSDPWSCASSCPRRSAWRAGRRLAAQHLRRVALRELPYNSRVRRHVPDLKHLREVREDGVPVQPGVSSFRSRVPRRSGPRATARAALDDHPGGGRQISRRRCFAATSRMLATMRRSAVLASPARSSWRS